MSNLMVPGRAKRCMSFIVQSLSAITCKGRAWRNDDALERFDDRLLRDIGIDRCHIRHVVASLRPTFAD